MIPPCCSSLSKQPCFFLLFHLADVTLAEGSDDADSVARAPNSLSSNSSKHLHGQVKQLAQQTAPLHDAAARVVSSGPVTNTSDTAIAGRELKRKREHSEDDLLAAISDGK